MNIDPLSPSNDEYYKRKRQDRKRRKRSTRRARNRGEAANKWFKNNRLTKDNWEEFHEIMDKADKEFDSEP